MTTIQGAMLSVLVLHMPPICNRVVAKLFCLVLKGPGFNLQHPFSAPHKPNVVTHMCNPRTHKQRHEDHKFRVTLPHIVNLNPTALYEALSAKKVRKMGSNSEIMQTHFLELKYIRLRA